MTKRANLDEPDRIFLATLHRLVKPTVQDICTEAGVTATAVRQRLNRLLNYGYIERKSVRVGRGRPHHTYHVTPDGQRILGEDYSILANVLWKELMQIPDESLRQQVMTRIRDAMVAQLGKGVDAENLDKRLQELQIRLIQQGFNVETGIDNGLPVLREFSCPFYDLANADPQICELERQVYEKILGVNVFLKSRCVEGHPCCEFIVQNDR
ncbi:MAG: transcriptional regulator [Planctomycetota bacterium]|nr:transcriptional regulator [Planctomycetota bacterium]MDA1212050.1 transcriptional regulator [Planctomycetota bacterium]